MKLQQSTESLGESRLKLIDSTSLLTNPILPTRKSPLSMHSKLFHGCVPFTGFRRSFSLPRHNFTPSKHNTLTDNFDSDIYHKSQSEYDEYLDASDKSKSDRSTGFDRLFSSPTSWLKESPSKCKRIKNRYTASRKNMERKLLSGHDNLIFDSSDAQLGEQLDSSIFFKQDMALHATESNIFCDPLIRELEAELPAPPPPPRACPPWLKIALAQQARSTQASHPSLSSPLNNNDNSQKSMGLAYNRFSVRIYPIIQNGVKISDTHYWLLDPPKPKSLYYQTSESAPSSPISSPNTGYLNLNASQSTDLGGASPKDVKLRRGQSEVSKECIDNFHQELVLRLMKTVPLATEPECQAVLIGTSYDFTEATKRLKLELLCRRGYFSRAHNRRILAKCDWDLDTSFQQADLEFESRKLRRQNRNLSRNHDSMKSSNSHHLLTTYSTTSSESSSSSPITSAFLQQTGPNFTDNGSAVSVLSMGQTDGSQTHMTKPASSSSSTVVGK